MTERERLIQLIKQKQDSGYKIGTCQINEMHCSNAELADYLLANGIYVTTCETCEYIKHMKERGRVIELMGKPLKFCPECGDEL